MRSEWGTARGDAEAEGGSDARGADSGVVEVLRGSCQR